jgi:hypothetical protein
VSAAESIEDLLAEAEASAESRAAPETGLFKDSAISELLATQEYRGSFRPSVHYVLALYWAS